MDTTARSRRDLLLAGAATAAGAAVAALAAPAAALATDGDVMHVGDDLVGTLTTSLAVSADSGLSVSTADVSAPAIRGQSTGVSSGTGVYGYSGSGIGVSGQSLGGKGLYGVADNGYGAHGTSTSGTGVFGASTTGRGVYGASGSGTGVEAFSGSGAALKVSGRAEFSRSGKGTIAKGSSSVRVTVPGGVTAATLGFANLRAHHAGVFITAVIPVPATGKLWIRLNKAAPAATALSWFALR